MGGDDTDLQQYILWANPKMSDDYGKRSSIWVNRNVWQKIFILFEVRLKDSRKQYNRQIKNTARLRFCIKVNQENTV
jgi:hypothetical protein